MIIKYNLLKNYFFKSFLFFIGSFMLFAYIWFRFIRERLPRDIPFKLSLIGLFILFYICLIYIILIFILYRNLKIKEETEINETNLKFKVVLSNFIEYIFLPLMTLDQFIKSLPVINILHKIIIINLAYKLSFFFITTQSYYYVFVLIPRIILLFTLFTLFTDVFYFNKLYYIYKIMYLAIFVLLNQYLIYSLTFGKKILIEELETFSPKGKISISYVEELFLKLYKENIETDPDHDDDDWLIEPWLFRWPVKISDYLEYIEKNFEKKKNITYVPQANRYYYKCYCKKYGIPYTEPQRNNVSSHLATTQVNHAYSELKQKYKDIFQLMSIIIKYKKITNKEEINKIKILIYVNYFICWFYVITVSLPTLNIDDIFSLLESTYKNILEPFSENIL